MSLKTMSDLAVYQRLVAMCEELETLGPQCRSHVGEAALQTAAMTLRGMASAVYEHSLNATGG